jgi:hypothetical protein
LLLTCVARAYVPAIATVWNRTRLHLDDVHRGAAGGFVVGVVAGDVDEAHEGLVEGFGVEGAGALVCDAFDFVEAFLDVGLFGPVGERGDGGLEHGREFGEAGVVVEPGLEELVVAGGEAGGGRVRLRGLMRLVGLRRCGCALRRLLNG